MIVGLEDEDARAGAPGECCHDKRRVKALRDLHRAYHGGALGDLAAGGLQLGSLEAGAWFPTRGEVEEEQTAFDGRLNSWMIDYQRVTNRLPAALLAQVDDFITRWRDLSGSFFVLSKPRADAILALEAEWNRIRDQIDGYGANTTIAPATVTVDGRQVRADQVPPGSSTFDRIETIVKWGGVALASAAVLKIASDLGIFARIGRLVGGRGGGGGGSDGGVRRYGSAKR
jgi:hypothetical protein